MSLPYYLNPGPLPAWLLTDNYLVLDFETTSLEKGSALNADNRLLMAAWWYKGEHKSRWADELDQKELMKDIDSCDLIVAHNARFEAHWLKRLGLDYGDKLMYDTMLGDYVIAGNRRMPFDLDSCAKRWGVKGKEGLVSKLMKSGIPIEEIPKRWVSEYCLDDVKACHNIFLPQRKSLNQCGLLAVLFTRCILTPVLASMESKGLQLDCERVLDEHEKQEIRYAEIEERLHYLLGEVNLNSPQQLATVLYEDLKFTELRKYGKPDRNAPNKAFPDGQPKTDMDTIRRLKARTKKQKEVQSLISEKSKVNARLTKNLNVFKALCQQKGGKLYGNFLQHSTRTHRLSSTGRKQELDIDGSIEDRGCQLQNLPREYKGLFAAPKGRVFVEADYSQLEFRAAGILGNDPQIKQDVLDGVDVHSNCRDVLNEAGMEVDRTGAKQWSFKPQYSEPPKKAKPSPTDKYAQYYKERYSALAETQTQWAHNVLNEKRMRTPWGLIYHFPHCRLSGSGYISDTTSIYNYPIQGFSGAEVVGPGLVYLYHRTKDTEGVDLVLTVHDSVEAEVDRDLLPWYAEQAARALTDDVYSYVEQVYGMDMTVPLGIGIVAGSHWSEDDLTQKEKYATVEHLKNCGFSQAQSDDDEIKIVYRERMERK